MLYFEKLNWDSKNISNYIKQENELVLSIVSDNISIYLPHFNMFAISNDLIDDLILAFKSGKKIILSDIKSINKKIPIFELVKIWNIGRNIIDINGLYYSKYHKPITNKIFMQFNKDWEWYYNIYKNFINSRYINNQNIPLPILYDLEYQNSISIWNIYNEYNSEFNSIEYYMYIMRCTIFDELENNGLFLNNKIIHPEYHVDNTYTGRVSCSWEKINFMALNKKSEINEQITSRFGIHGKLYNFDYDSFHPRIIFNILKNPIPYDVNGHEYLSNKYFIDNTESKKEIKQKIFKILYGSKILNNKLSEIMSNFTEKIDFLKTNLDRRIENIEDRKKLNYFIQKYEVDLIMDAMYHIIELLKKFKSKIILYQYDSLIFDIHNSENKLIEEIKNIMENINNMKFKIKIKNGNNLKEIR